jgi:capsular exopolysaccharide synthesis family protein
MSRNFELMQHIGKSLEVFEPEVDREIAPVSVDEDVVVPIRLEGPERDEMAKLVNRVFLAGAEAPRRVVFMGADAGTGCSRICAGAAELLAATAGGRSVCVVDANLRAPSLHEQFGLENQQGLTDALLQGGPVRKYISRLAGDKLTLMTAGSSVEGWQTLLGSQQMQTRISELQREYDYILMDIPPLSVCSDAIALARMSEGVILVIRAQATRREVAQQVVKELKSAHVSLLGAILNDRRFPIPESLYQRL